MKFNVIDTTTDDEPNYWELSTEKWVEEHLIWSDIEGFAIEEDGSLVLLDECGNYVYCPEDRFRVVVKEG